MKTAKAIIIGLALFAMLSLAALAKTGDDNATTGVSNKNMTFGQCVSDGAAVKNACYATVKEKRDTCVASAKNMTDSAAEKKCRSDYKSDKKACKQDFKTIKKACGKIKHNFMDTMKASFK